MSNALGIAWRIPCPGLRPSSLFPSNPATTVLRSVSRDLRISAPWRPYSIARQVARQSFTSPFAQLQSIRSSPFVSRSFSAAGPLYSQPPVEYGVPVDSQPLSAAQINAIFGKGRVSPEMGNRLIAVLQGRRLAGTPELELPHDITRSVRLPYINTALRWLRLNYPLDEEAIILARVEREDLEAERLAEQQGLYRPQSGSYGAELGENNDPSGRSILKEARKKNEAWLLAEQERKRQEWLAGEERHRKNLLQQAQKNKSVQMYQEQGVMEARERADPSQRPLMAYIQKKHLEATNSDMETGAKFTIAERIIPSLLITLLTIGLGYLFAVSYDPPARSDRMWPDCPPAAATILTIIGLNAGIWLAWKFPPAWKLLNRYFINLPFYPRAFTMIGGVFSQQSFFHLATNMGVLWLVGTKLHDDIGRGNFLALYMASGAVGSLTSHVARILTGNLLVPALGASAAVSGVLAAWLMMHFNQNLTLVFIPSEWQDIASAKASWILAGVVALEIIHLATPWKIVRADHWSHFGGYVVGILGAMAVKKQREMRREEAKKQKKKKGWFIWI